MLKRILIIIVSSLLTAALAINLVRFAGGTYPTTPTDIYFDSNKFNNYITFSNLKHMFDDFPTFKLDWFKGLYTVTDIFNNMLDNFQSGDINHVLRGVAQILTLPVKIIIVIIAFIVTLLADWLYSAYWWLRNLLALMGQTELLNSEWSKEIQVTDKVWDWLRQFLTSW